MGSLRTLGLAALATLAGCDGYSLPAPTYYPLPELLETVEPCAVIVNDGNGERLTIERRYYDAAMRHLGRVALDLRTGDETREAWAYDDRDRVVAYRYRSNVEPAVLYPSGGASLRELHAYDDADNRVRTVVVHGNALLDPTEIRRAFDEAGRPVLVEERKGDALIRRQTFAYDAAGRVVEQSDTRPEAARAWRMAYDDAGRMTERVTTDAEGARVERWVFDAEGLREATIDRDGDGVVDFRARRVERAGGHDMTDDEGDDGRVERRISTRVDGERETVTTDHGDDGIPERVVVTIRAGDTVRVETDADGDGAVDTIVETVTRDDETEVRHDADGDGAFEEVVVTHVGADGALRWTQVRTAEGRVLRSFRVSRDDAGRLVREASTLGDPAVDEALVEETVYLYDCGFNPYAPYPPTGP